MNRFATLFLATCCLVTGGVAHGVLQNVQVGGPITMRPALAQLEQEFLAPPMEARRLTGPLFWLHGDESPELLESYIEKVAEGGNGCFTAESRPHVDWLGEGWYRDLAVCLEAAKRLDLKMWIFDEKWWPSGEVGGNVPEQYATKFLEAARESIKGPGTFSSTFDQSKLVAVVAGKEAGDGTIDGSSLIDLGDFAQDGALSWNAPDGNWVVMIFAWRYAERRGSRGHLVDGASRDAVDWYIQTVYQPHYDRFPDDFGKAIVGYFYDEPETPGDWGSEVLPMLAGRGVDWKKALVAWKFALAGEEQVAAKYQYQDALAEAWGQTMYAGITKWCNEHGVQSIGHFLEHGKEYLHPHLCAGNMMQLQKYSDMGAIDAVFTQFKPGHKDDNTYQTPKLGSSISHVYGKSQDLAMVEIFGARGQDLTYPEMKWWTDLMQVAGINFMIPHSFNPRAPMDTDCPPYFYNGGFEPRWPLYRVWADYTTRLSLMLTGGHHVCPVALLFLGNSAHVGKHITPENMTTALQDALYDCDWIPYDVFENDFEFHDSAMALRQERYQVLVVPAVEAIPYATLAKARDAFNSGCTVIGYGLLPTVSATLGKTASDIAALREEIWCTSAVPGLSPCRTNANGGRSYFLPEKPSVSDVREVLADAGMTPDLDVLEGDTGDWLHVLHRVKNGSDVFFVTNQNHEGEARPFRFRAKAKGVPELWDAMRGEIASIPFDRVSEDTVDFSLTLDTLESFLLVFRPQEGQAPVLVDDSTAPAFPAIPVARIPNPPAPEKPAEEAKEPPVDFEGCRWVWYPEGNALEGVPAGTRYFRAHVNVPDGRTVSEAAMLMTCDNGFVLYVNGTEAGMGNAAGEDWRRAKRIDLKDALRNGDNVLAVAATNGDLGGTNPAGLIGVYHIALDNGDVLTGSIDATWRASVDAPQEWNEAGFDDGAWVAAQAVVAYPGGPWGRVTEEGMMLTKSPVDTADPFRGAFTLPEGFDPAQHRVYVTMTAPKPEAAARITVNGQYAGGMIGAPFRLNVSQHVQTGENTLIIEPFAPREVQIAVYGK